MKPARLFGYDFGVAAVAAADVTVDLGYSSYQGYHDGTYGLNVWKGIRYAEPPIGSLRWQPPQPPRRTTCKTAIPAVDKPPLCPQSGSFGVPDAYGLASAPGDEDCLFLNVYAGSHAQQLPVLVWIHGGGYGVFGATSDPSVWMTTNDKAFIVVEIQYRLGAFGFLSSEEVKAHGRLNAGLLDQRLALEWVRHHIAKFGGDPARVTVAGESAGAASAMYHALARGGESSDLFSNIWIASPWLPPLYDHDGPVPAANYRAFADLAGCGHNSSTRARYNTTFDCLVAADTTALQNASATVSTTRGYWGSWAFLPVVDGDYIQMLPSRQLALGKVAGKRILVGTNANEGVPLTYPRINSRADFDSFISTTFPALTDADVARLNTVYQTATTQESNTGPRSDTRGDCGPTALNVSDMATGLQQTAFTVAAEARVHCPAQWLSRAFSRGANISRPWEHRCSAALAARLECPAAQRLLGSPPAGANTLQAWKYQYSPAPAYHGADLDVYFATNATAVPSTSLRLAMHKMLGGFVINDTPVVTVQEAQGGCANSTVPSAGDGNIAWPEHTPEQPWQMDLNTTGGTTALVTPTDDLSFSVRTGAGVVNDFRVVNGNSWEGRRGDRCGFWKSVAHKIPI